MPDESSSERLRALKEKVLEAKKELLAKKAGAGASIPGNLGRDKEGSVKAEADNLLQRERKKYLQSGRATGKRSASEDEQRKTMYILEEFSKKIRAVDSSINICDIHKIENCESCKVEPQISKDDGWQHHKLLFQETADPRHDSEELIVIDPRSKTESPVLEQKPTNK